jgi:hypothetical protein
MKITFQNVTKKTQILEFDDISVTFNSITKQVLDSFNMNNEQHTLKYIYKGSILKSEQKLSEINDENPTIIILANKKAQQAQQVQVQQVQAQQVQQESHVSQAQPISDISSLDRESHNPISALQMSVIGILTIIRNDPRLLEMFNNNFEELQQLLIQPEFGIMIQSIIQNMNGSINQNLPDLDQSDYEKIKILEAFGYSKDKCIEAYLICNKNIDMAASMLLDE